jgi:hypothetical protein
MASLGGWIAKKMENLLPVGLGQLLLILGRAGLKAIFSVRDTKRALGESSFAGLFSDTPQARPRGKASISGALTLDFRLSPWRNEEDGVERSVFARTNEKAFLKSGSESLIVDEWRYSRFNPKGLSYTIKKY